MRRGLAIITFGAVLAVPGLASAQSECPDGWFCEPESPAAEDNESTQGEQAEAEPAPEPGSKPEPAAPRSSDKPKPAIVVSRPEHVPPPPRRRRQREWGVNLRLEGVLMNREGRTEEAGMGGLGVSFRYRPIPYFAFDAGLDFVGGTDWAGNERQETALLLSAMVFFNPRNPIQVYALGGIGFSGARVTLEEPDVRNTDGSITPGYELKERYSYFGAHLGAGLEFRVSRKVALNLDVLGFVRGRTDELSEEQPEFIDANTGRATNTSGGGLARAGITFYW